MGPVRSTAEVRREDIVAAAIVEFATSGRDGTSTEAIARRAGVSQPYVFRLFGTKKALFMAAVERSCQRVRDTFEAAASAAIAQGADPFDAMGAAYFELLADRDWLMVQLHGYASCDDLEVRDLVRRRYGNLWQWLQTLPAATPERVQAFMAMGMLLNVAAAMDLPSVIDQEAWMAECLASPKNASA